MPETTYRQEPQMTDRDEAIRQIRAALRRRSGRAWSVTGGRGTAWGWITITAPRARRAARAGRAGRACRSCVGSRPGGQGTGVLMAEIVEPFGGPGGWSEALRRAGIEAEAIGFDLSADACATAQAAGHRRECFDISPVTPPAAEMTIASPPCWAWSTSGLKRARGDRQIVMEAIASYARGDDRLAEARREVEEPPSLLVVEPLRWALMSGSRRLLLEQVPSVLPCWQVMAEGLRRHGYSVWTGIVEAADYGVPQTRQRAVLIASRAEPVRPPVPT